MVVLLVIIVYFLVGIVANKLYGKRDIICTKQIEDKIDRHISQLSLDEESEWWLCKELSKKSIDHAGWFFWRRKLPTKWSIKYANIVSFPFWIIDIFMCELGYIRERKYINSLN